MQTSVTCYDSKGELLEELVQWDVNVTIQVEGADISSMPNFHFCQKGRNMAYVVPATNSGGKLKAAVPNILLQSRYPLVVFLYYGSNPGEQRSKYHFQIPIIPREVPMEYVYIENIGYENWVQMTKEAQSIIEANENLTERLQQSAEVLAQMDAKVKSAQTAESNASKHEQGAKQALTDATAAKSAAQQSATDADASKKAAAGSATTASDAASRASASEGKAKGYADAALESQNAASGSAAAALKSQQAAAGSADAASKSQAQAATSAQTATTQASAASTSAEQAAASKADAAKSKEAAEAAKDTAVSSAESATASEKLAKQYKDAAETANTSAAAHEAAAANSDKSAAKHLADALAAKEAAETARDGAESASEEATQQATDAAASAETAKQYSGNPAIPKNGTWWIWDAENQQYKDTGKRAVLKPDKVYDSVDAMNQDKAQEINTLAIISTSINEEDNAKLYIWDGEQWQFLADLSGFTGVGIEKIEKKDGENLPGTFDTYTITLDDKSTFDFKVYNGADGDGAGDMTQAIYDPQGRMTDIFKYIDERILNLVVSDDGHGNVTIQHYCSVTDDNVGNVSVSF